MYRITLKVTSSTLKFVDLILYAWLAVFNLNLQRFESEVSRFIYDIDNCPGISLNGFFTLDKPSLIGVGTFDC